MTPRSKSLIHTVGSVCLWGVADSGQREGGGYILFEFVAYQLGSEILVAHRIVKNTKYNLKPNLAFKQDFYLLVSRII